MSRYDFPECMHDLSAALHILRIDPATVTVTLPRDKWWDLYCHMERTMPGFMVGSCKAGREAFQYQGFTFRPQGTP